MLTIRCLSHIQHCSGKQCARPPFQSSCCNADSIPFPLQLHWAWIREPPFQQSPTVNVKVKSALEPLSHYCASILSRQSVAIVDISFSTWPLRYSTTACRAMESPLVLSQPSMRAIQTTSVAARESPTMISWGSWAKVHLEKFIERSQRRRAR